MKKTILTIFIVAATTMLLSSCGGGTSNETPSSNEVNIGKQVWMTKNLDVSTFRNGDKIPEAKSDGEWKAYGDAGEAAWCYYENNPANGTKYGKLYNWYAVNDPRGLAPRGWHVPSDEEWTLLTDYLGGEEKAGAKMKSQTGWSEDGIGTNSSGYSGLPGGFRGYDIAFLDVGSFGSWWSSTENVSDIAWCRKVGYDDGDVSRHINNKKEGMSVRCLRD